MDGSDHEKERRELLSSPFIENPKDDTKKEEEDQDVDENTSPSTKSGTISRSPLRFRERLANLFGSGRNASVDEDLKSIADTEAEDQESVLQDTIKSTETRGSSLFNEQQTYYNTIRNQHIEVAQDAEVEEKILPISDLPPSRLYLSVYPEQSDYFHREKEMIIQSMNNYPLMYKWKLGYLR